MKVTDRLLQSFLGDTPFNSKRYTGDASRDLVKSTSPGGMLASGPDEQYGETEEGILFQLRFPNGELLNATASFVKLQFGSNRLYDTSAGRLTGDGMVSITGLRAETFRKGVPERKTVVTDQKIKRLNASMRNSVGS